MQSYKAGGDLSAGLYLFLKRGLDEQQVLQAGAGEETLGIQHNEPETTNTGEGIDTAMAGGGAKLIIGLNGLNGNAHLKSDADGKGVVATSGDFVGAILDIGTTEITTAGNVYPVIVTAFNEA